MKKTGVFAYPPEKVHSRTGEAVNLREVDNGTENVLNVLCFPFSEMTP